MTLPPLPDDRRYSNDAHYSADQMRAYGEACAAAERERAARVAEQQAECNGLAAALGRPLDWPVMRIERFNERRPTMGAGYKPEDHDGLQDAWAEQNAADEKVARLERRLGEAADKALTYAESYELAVARLVLAMDYMHPEQKRAFNAAWAEKRAELRALALGPNVEVSRAP